MKRPVVVLLLILLSAVACVDKTEEFTIPFAPVNFEVHLASYDVELRNALAYKVFTEAERRRNTDRFGFAGLLVVSDVTGNLLFAYDLCCPYEDNKSIKVLPDGNGKAECTSCGSVFVTMYGQGSVVKGPASQSLQRYRIIPLYQDIYQIGN